MARPTSEATTEAIQLGTDEPMFRRAVDRVIHGRARVIVEMNGTPVAAVVSPADIERLRRLDEIERRGWEALERIGQAFADVPLDELEREVAKAVAEVRAERARATGPSSITR